MWGMYINADLIHVYHTLQNSQVVLVVKNSPANAGDIRVQGSIMGLGRSPGGGHGNQLQYSCLENPKDRGAWQFTVHRVTRSWTRLKWLHMNASYITKWFGSAQFSSVAQSCPTLCNPVNHSMLGLPVHHKPPWNYLTPPLPDRIAVSFCGENI